MNRHADMASVARWHVEVLDATGTEIAASMEVTATGTQIVVRSAALRGAIYPLLIDPQVGTNDFRISDMGPDGNRNFDAFDPAVAYDSFSNRYLVVWSGDDNIAPLVDGEFEIFGQQLSATGFEIGANDFRISDMGPDRDITFDANNPDVAYNGTDKRP